MANKRTFQLQCCTTNGVALGGVSQLETEEGFADEIVSDHDGAYGAEEVDRAGKLVRVTLTTTDILKLLDVLIATPGDTIGYEKQSGAATYVKTTIGTTSWTGARLTIPKNADATIQFTGEIRFGLTDDFEDVAQFADEVAVDDLPAFTHPARYYRAHGASFAANPAITPLHVDSFTLGLAARVIRDYGDEDYGHTALDIVGWNPAEIGLSLKDQTKMGTDPYYDVGTALLKAGIQDLAIDLVARGGGTDKTMTVRVVDFKSKRKGRTPEYATVDLSGTSRWRNPVTPFTQYDLDAAPLISFA